MNDNLELPDEYQGTVSKDVALQATNEGFKIKHKSFTGDEYLHRPEGQDLQTEEGYLVSQDFWSYRTQEHWDYGWTIKL
jgi:hypothetical protein